MGTRERCGKQRWETVVMSWIIHLCKWSSEAEGAIVLGDKKNGHRITGRQCKS